MNKLEQQLRKAQANWSSETGDDWDLTFKRVQELIDDGMAWRLEGHIGRTAMSFLKSGHCFLPEVVHSDYYGNRIPSRDLIKPRAFGSLEFAAKTLLGDNE